MAVPSLNSSPCSTNAFSLKDLGEPHYFLGMEVTKTATGLHLSQGKYIPALLIGAKMIDAKGIATPMVTTLSLSAHTADPFPDSTIYRSIVGALQYVTITRPDNSLLC